MSSILLIDGDTATIKKARTVLGREGYHVDYTLPGRAALRTLLDTSPDLVILGVDSHEKGWQFCRQVLTSLEQPLLLLLSTDDELDRVKGLELGADDCMVKPVLLVELVARVRALLRRGGSPTSGRKGTFFVDGDLIVDLTRREVRLNDRPVAVTPTEFRLLSSLIRHVGEVVSHDQLCLQVWGPSHMGSRHIIKQYIHHLRRKLEPDPERPRRIVTRWGKGYMFTRLALEKPEESVFTGVH